MHDAMTTPATQRQPAIGSIGSAVGARPTPALGSPSMTHNRPTPAAPTWPDASAPVVFGITAGSMSIQVAGRST
jgi:hypothetical protein